MRYTPLGRLSSNAEKETSKGELEMRKTIRITLLAIVVCIAGGCGPKPTTDKNGNLPSDIHVKAVKFMNEGKYEEASKFFHPDRLEKIKERRSFTNYCDFFTRNKSLSSIGSYSVKKDKTEDWWYSKLTTVNCVSHTIALVDGEWKIIK